MKMDSESSVGHQATLPTTRTRVQYLGSYNCSSDPGNCAHAAEGVGIPWNSLDRGLRFGKFSFANELTKPSLQTRPVCKLGEGY